MPIRRNEMRALAEALREDGRSWHLIAAALRAEYPINARVAMRMAHRWSQATAASEWNRRWPDEPKTFKNFSYWENWPAAGHMPSLTTLERLALLYECDVADLLADYGEHRKSDRQHVLDQAAREEDTTVLWRVAHMDLAELTDSVARWFTRAAVANRYALLLKLSTAAALAASAHPERRPTRGSGPQTRIDGLAGVWLSRYQYASSGRAGAFEDFHRVLFRAQDGQLLGRSLQQDDGSELELELAIHGTVASGSWTERTSPSGYYRAATYHGLLHLVVDPTGRSMHGQWLGVGKRFAIKSGEWSFTWERPATESEATGLWPDR